MKGRRRGSRVGGEEADVRGRGKKKEGGARGMKERDGKEGSMVKTKQSKTPKKITIMESKSYDSYDMIYIMRFF